MKYFILVIVNFFVINHINSQVLISLKTFTTDSLADVATSIIETEDGNFIVTGNTGGHVALSQADAWIIKLNSNFDTLWTIRRGGNGFDLINDITKKKQMTIINTLL